jgi:hypothetical protein
LDDYFHFAHLLLLWLGRDAICFAIGHLLLLLLVAVVVVSVLHIHG